MASKQVSYDTHAKVLVKLAEACDRVDDLKAECDELRYMHEQHCQYVRTVRDQAAIIEKLAAELADGTALLTEAFEEHEGDCKCPPCTCSEDSQLDVRIWHFLQARGVYKAGRGVERIPSDDTSILPE